MLTGRGPATRVSGRRVSSKVFDLGVRADGLGLPAYAFEGSGPIEIDKQEQPDAFMLGRFVLAPNFQLFGLLQDSSFGAGDVKGNLRVPEGSAFPTIDLSASTIRRVRATGRLTEAIEPVLSVQPTSRNFGAVRLDETAPPTQVFSVQNVGAGTLSGEASFLGGSSPDFRFVGDATYTNLARGDLPVGIEVEFAPSSAGAKSTQILFGVNGGAGARIVSVSGVGGVPEIGVSPTSGAFGNVAVGRTSAPIAFIVSNTGDGVLEGVATLSGSSDFELLRSSGDAPVASISYSLQPRQELTLRVRFKPSSLAAKTGTLGLTGGAGAQVPLTGTGIP